MENKNFDALKKYPTEFIDLLSGMLKDKKKYSELEQVLKRYGVTIESQSLKVQITIQNQTELKSLKEFLNEQLEFA
ncbi:MAG: hypothetical protein CVU05_09030 [Bacteroidetes bacterium HGW-Bacteroidetes-21]|jgi:hypothetical protein|nr:MAG: hypothetical protein CVU05_09030 [Bacteroidetes bacterium HGW-Bacteroidetes-21]